MKILFVFPIYLAYASFFSVIIPLLFLLWKGKHNFKSPVLRILGLLLFIAFFSDLASYVLGKMGRSNSAIDNIYTIAEFFLLSYIYSFIFRNRTLIYIGLVLFTGFFIVNIAFIQPFTEFQSWPRAIESIILGCYSILYYIQDLKIKNTKIPITNEISVQNLQESRKLYESIFNPATWSGLWINSAVFFYFIANFSLFIMSDYVFKSESPEIGMLFWSFHNGINSIKNILFAVAIYQAGCKAVYAWSNE